MKKEKYKKEEKQRKKEEMKKRRKRRMKRNICSQISCSQRQRFMVE